MDRRIDNALDTWMYGISGSIASTMTTLILYPVENVKSRIQISENQTGKAEKMTEIIQQVYKKEGIQGFYKGITPLLTGNFISYGIYFFWYELLKNYFGADISDVLGYSKAACISGIITTFGTNPFWVIQTRMTFQKQKENFLKVSYNMAKKEGLGSFFKGLEASLGLVWNPIIQFIIYENLKKRLCRILPQFVVNFIAGAISKAFATLCTYPYQVIRTHSHLNKSKTKLTYIAIIKKIFKQYGWKGFFRGMQAKLSQSVLNAAFMLAIYELTFKIIKGVIDQSTNKYLVSTI